MASSSRLACGIPLTRWGLDLALVLVLLCPVALAAVDVPGASQAPTPASGPAAAPVPAVTPVLEWRPWSDDLFAIATREKRLVLLDLQAVWCHWCHVMDETTYRDPDVVRLLQQKFILVRVDQDSRPDLSNRYEDYGWPATVVFSPTGEELVKRAGYLPPRPMASLLQALIDDPTPGPSIVAAEPVRPPASGGLDQALRDRLLASFRDGYDQAHAGWGSVHKYLDADDIEYALLRARGGGGALGPEAGSLGMARGTLAAAQALIDPVWGGLYQYSVGGGWDQPHFEKIMAYQADGIRTWALAAATVAADRAQDLRAARRIDAYLRAFLTSPEGAFYTSQDADRHDGEDAAGYFALDDAGRRLHGIPRVDTHCYARENGWAIAALAQLWAVTGDRDVLMRAERAADWVRAHRRLPDGGYAHGDRDPGGPYLGDTLAMTRAELAVYGVTGERRWLRFAREDAAAMQRRFAPAMTVAGLPAGYLTAQAGPGGPALPPTAERDENIGVARTANLLFQYTGDPELRAMAARAMRFVAAPSIARRPPTAGVLLADAELAAAPLHLTVVGGKDDPAAAALFAAACADPCVYKRVEWFDAREGPLPNPDVPFPQLPGPVLFLCTADRCSAPVSSAAQVRPAIDRALHRVPAP